MNALTTLRSVKTITRTAMGLTAAAALLALPSLARADDSVTMAPPVSAPYDQSNPDAPANASADTVFQWTETPEGQEIRITRAVFDRGGYQLYDDQGETIVVPFTNKNLYVMKFAQSKTGHTYFVNEGAVPVLYVPKNGYLENATVDGARWYPFSKDFHPDRPVYEGIAPSYSEFIDLGWFPETHYFGGYYCNTPFVGGGVFLPSAGLCFEVGGHPYYGWGGYQDYSRFHPAPYRTDYFDRDVYRFADRPASDFHRFDGGDGHAYYAHRAFTGGDGFRGGPRPAIARQPSRDGGSFGGDRNSGGRTFSNNDRAFNNGNSGRVFTNNGGNGGGRVFRGGDHTFTNANGGGRPFTNGGGGSHDFGGGNFGGGRQNSAGTDNGASRRGQPSGAITRGGDQGFGGHNFGGGTQPSSGGRGFGGGNRDVSNGNDRNSGNGNAGNGNARGGFGGGGQSGNDRGGFGGGGFGGGGGGFSGGSHVRGGR